MPMGHGSSQGFILHTLPIVRDTRSTTALPVFQRSSSKVAAPLEGPPPADEQQAEPENGRCDPCHKQPDGAITRGAGEELG